MAYRASQVSEEPLDYFLREREEGSLLHIADVILRENKDPKEVFAHLIRIATQSKWSHAALVFLVSDPPMGYNNMFLTEATTKGIRVTSWRNEVVPFKQFTVGIKRLNLDWYIETDYEKSLRDPHDPKDTTHGITYLRHVRGIAFDQVNGLFDHKSVYELSARYIERAARRHLSGIPQVAEAADAVANLFKKWDESDDARTQILRFICSGLIQYSFFEALRRRIMLDMDVLGHRDIAMHHLDNLPRVIFRDDPRGLVPEYIQQVRSGKLDIHDPAPEDVLDLLKTATPADFNNSPNLSWLYVVRNGVVWKIEEVSEGYQPQSAEEGQVLEMLSQEHFSEQDHV